MGSDYWDGYYRWMQEMMFKEKRYIAKEDLDFIFLEDDPDKVVRIIEGFYPEGYRLNF